MRTVDTGGAGGPIIDWAAERIALHAGSILTGAVGGLIGALRLRERRIGTALKWVLVGGLIAPYVGASARAFGIAPSVADSLVLLGGMFSFRLFEIIASLLDRAAILARQRLDRVAGE